MQYKCMACSAKCSMCSMKCTDAVSCAFAGAGTVRNVHCAVCGVQVQCVMCTVQCAGCSVLPTKDGNFAVETE